MRVDPIPPASSSTPHRCSTTPSTWTKPPSSSSRSTACPLPLYELGAPPEPHRRVEFAAATISQDLAPARNCRSSATKPTAATCPSSPPRRREAAGTLRPSPAPYVRISGESAAQLRPTSGKPRRKPNRLNLRVVFPIN